MQDKTLLYTGLSYCPFLKGKEKRFLAETLEDLAALSRLSLNDLSLLLKRPLKTKLWKKGFIETAVQDGLKIIGTYGIKTVSVFDEAFPPQLREIPDSPLMLFYRGSLPDPERPSAAMVGTRRPTGEGIQAALNLSKQFAENGVPVISGLAYGIDTFSHRGCLEGGGKTVAVLACGVESIYPRTNKRLAAAILESDGCIISEYPPGTEPLQFRFPERNRIVSGLSRSVIIVEAPEKSGALITADFALEQGRDVFVCKAVLNSPQNAGGRRLNEEGARAVSGAEDVLNEWQYLPAKRNLKNDLPLFGS